MLPSVRVQQNEDSMVCISLSLSLSLSVRAPQNEDDAVNVAFYARSAE